MLISVAELSERCPARHFSGVRRQRRRGELDEASVLREALHRVHGSSEKLETPSGQCRVLSWGRGAHGDGPAGVRTGWTDSAFQAA